MDLDAFLKNLKVNDVVAQLQAAPEAISEALLKVEVTRTSVTGAREDLKLAEANAEALAWATVNSTDKKMLADEKKANVEKLIGDDPNVKVAKDLVADFEGEHSRAVADYERAKAQMSAARSLSDLASSTLIFVASRPANGKH